MTSGDESRRAHARPDMIDLTYIYSDLATAVLRLGTAARLGTSEEHAMARQPERDRDAVLGRWRQANGLIMEALAELEQAHQCLEAGARHVFQAVGDADDRAAEGEGAA